MTYRKVEIAPSAWVAPNATIVGNVTVEDEALVLFNAVLRGDCGSRIVVGAGSNIQENCCLHVDHGADCIIGRDVTVGHNAVIHGCTIGDNSLIGMGAVVMNHAEIGCDCLVAAGALVTQGTLVPDGSLVMGSPAKVRRALTPEEIEANRASAADYQQVGRDLAAEGIVYEGRAIPKGLMTLAV